MTGEDPASAAKASWKSRVAEAVRELPRTYPESRPLAVALRTELADALARALEPQINAHIRSMPHDGYGEKQALATWLNHELHTELGMAIRCPRTGRAAILLADRRSAGEDSGRFRLEVHDEGGRNVRTYTSTVLPEIRLMADPPRREFFRWSKGSANRPPER